MGKSSPYTHKWFLDKNYTQNPDGSYSPPAIKSEYIQSKFGIVNEEMIVKDIITPTPDFSFRQIIDNNTLLTHKSKPLVVFNIDPIGAPRMTRSDKWKLDPFHKDERKRQRKPVTQYFKFRSDIKLQAKIASFTMPDNSFHVVFVVPMPHSWSDKKKGQMDGGPHQQKPDADNMIKAVKDSLCESDAHIWDYRITKYWGRTGKIVIYQI